MASSWHYPRWRRLLMQFTMLLLLGGTVALAGWVSRDRNRQRGFAPLTQTVHVGSIDIRLPGDWAVFSQGRGMLVIRTGGRQSGLRFNVGMLPVTDGRTPEDFLLGPQGVLRDQLSDDNAPAVSSLAFGSVPGALVQIPADPTDGAAAVDRWFACGIFPGTPRSALLLECDVRREPGAPAVPSEQDETGQLLRAIAATAHQQPQSPQGESPI